MNHPLELIRKYGGSSSDAILDPLCSIFQNEGIEGLIGYKETKHCLVVIGDPVSKSEDKLKLALAFEEFCKRKGKHSLYFIVSKDFVEQGLKHFAKAYIHFGKELYVDPHKNPKNLSGPHACLVRRKFKHAAKEGVEVFELKDRNESIEEGMNLVAKKWLESRNGLQAYISHVRLFEDEEGKRWFYALKDKQIVGVVVLNQIKDKQGWHLNHLMTLPQSPGGTPEALVQKAIDTLEEENCSYLSFGQSPSPQVNDIQGFGKITTFLLKMVFKFAIKWGGLSKHGGFWDKFDPEFRPSFLLFIDKKIHFKELIGLIKAMNLEIK
jgi:lysylphosphatidylglycerol synthetase-like protein (DUF2156 family)